MADVVVVGEVDYHLPSMLISVGLAGLPTDPPRRVGFALGQGRDSAVGADDVAGRVVSPMPVVATNV